MAIFSPLKPKSLLAYLQLKLAIRSTLPYSCLCCDIVVSCENSSRPSRELYDEGNTQTSCPSAVQPPGYGHPQEGPPPRQGLDYLRENQSSFPGVSVDASSPCAVPAGLAAHLFVGEATAEQLKQPRYSAASGRSRLASRGLSTTVHRHQEGDRHRPRAGGRVGRRTGQYPRRSLGDQRAVTIDSQPEVTGEGALQPLRPARRLRRPPTAPTARSWRWDRLQPFDPSTTTRSARASTTSSLRG